MPTECVNEQEWTEEVESEGGREGERERGNGERETEGGGGRENPWIVIESY